MADSPTSKNYVWQSGDFVEPPRKQPPFNGITITAVPTYDDNGALSVLAVAVKDFTKVKQGETVDHTFEPVLSGESFQLQSKGNFTVQGPLDLKLTPALPTDIVIFVNLFYGLANMQHHADGGILAIPLAGPPSTSRETPAGHTPGQEQNLSIGSPTPDSKADTEPEMADKATRASKKKPTTQKPTSRRRTPSSREQADTD